MLEKLNEILEKEFQEKNEAIINELKSIKETLEQTKAILFLYEQENKVLKNEINQIEMFKVFKDLINVKNISSVLPYFNLKHNSWEIGGMDSEDIPQWFKLVFHYYEDKERLFTLFDMFNIEYPAWGKNYVMPYEWNKEELELFINPKYSRGVTNDCNFNGNTGFFWRNISVNKGDTYKILTKGEAFATAIPWQLVLSNPLWKTNKLFNKIIDAIKNNQRGSTNYFHIQDYLELSKEQIKELAKLLPKDKFWDSHKRFIENNKDILKTNNDLAEKFRNKINDNQFSTFYYLNYPVQLQKDFIRNTDYTFYTRTSLIKKMNISKNEKLDFLNEFAEIELE